jgi:hypothetical protein
MVDSFGIVDSVRLVNNSVILCFSILSWPYEIMCHTRICFRKFAGTFARRRDLFAVLVPSSAWARQILPYGALNAPSNFRDQLRLWHIISYGHESMLKCEINELLTKRILSTIPKLSTILRTRPLVRSTVSGDKLGFLKLMFNETQPYV